MQTHVRTAVIVGAAVALLVGCGQSDRRVEGDREGGAASPTYPGRRGIADTGPTAPDGGVKSGVPSSNNPPGVSDAERARANDK